LRAASARDESLDNKTTLAPCPANTWAMASPIPIEAPVTTTTFPLSSMFAFVFAADDEVKMAGTMS
jgi:hypothetical protein